MNKSWVVSIVNAYDNIVHMTRVNAGTEEEATYEALLNICKDQETRAAQETWNGKMQAMNLDAVGIRNELFDNDINIGVLEI